MNTLHKQYRCSSHASRRAKVVGDLPKAHMAMALAVAALRMTSLIALAWAAWRADDRGQPAHAKI